MMRQLIIGINIIVGNRSIISGDTNGRYFMKQAGIESENTLGFGSKLHNACSIEYPNRS